MSNLKKKYVTTMPDGSKWGVPVTVIAADRANYYAKEFGGDARKSLHEDTGPLFEADDFEIEDWAQNNMNWENVKDHAMCIEPAKCDFQEGWMNGEHEILDNSQTDVAQRHALYLDAANKIECLQKVLQQVLVDAQSQDVLSEWWAAMEEALDA